MGYGIWRPRSAGQTVDPSLARSVLSLLPYTSNGPGLPQPRTARCSGTIDQANDAGPRPQGHKAKRNKA